MEKLTKEEQERLGLYTGRFQALWDNYFFRMEACEHRKDTIGLDPTPEEKKRWRNLRSGLRDSHGISKYKT